MNKITVDLSGNLLPNGKYKNLKLVAYHPLCETAQGKRAVRNKHIPPYVDGACRREPDFEHEYPAITALCRQNAFAPHINIGDIVVYITIRMGGVYKLIAFLNVIHIEKSHIQGAEWYWSKNLPLPSNCMVDGNPPKPLDEIAGKSGCHTQARCDQHDEKYLQKSIKMGHFNITRHLIKPELYNPPTVDIAKILKRNPGLRNFNYLTFEELKQFGKLYGIEFIEKSN